MRGRKKNLNMLRVKLAMQFFHKAEKMLLNLQVV